MIAEALIVSALLFAIGTKVNYVIGYFYHVQIMLNYQNRISFFYKLV